jgi:LuxR family quorum-sensing system transcriptional regulator CciR
MAGLQTLHDKKPATGGEQLSRQERRCLQLYLNGLKDAEIARRLGLSIHTVRMHLTRARRRLRAQSRVEAAAKALRSGMIHASFLLLLNLSFSVGTILDKINPII